MDYGLRKNQPSAKYHGLPRLLGDAVLHPRQRLSSGFAVSMDSERLRLAGCDRERVGEDTGDAH